MAIWIWVIIIVVALAVFIPVKIFLTKKFLSAMKKKEDDNIIDE